MATQDEAAVHRALLLQFDFGTAAVLLVNPSTPDGHGFARPMSSERIALLRRRSMDIDADFAQRLADVIGGPASPIQVPAGAEQLLPWDGAPPDVADSGFFYEVDGREAAIVQLYPVAFSPDGERALTFLDTHCGPLECGAGSVALLRREGVDWVLESHVWTWES